MEFRNWKFEITLLNTALVLYVFESMDDLLNLPGKVYYSTLCIEL